MTMPEPTAIDDSLALDPATLPLWGSRLIEASAGTGKTWTIAALYLRLVLGHGGEAGFGRPLLPAEILVMTFTRAATRELSDRIRARLVEAAQCFRGLAQPAAHDGFLVTLLAAYPAGLQREQAAFRLAHAAEGMDDAAVHTIDAWCQRMLREHAFDSGNLFDETLLADEQALLREACQDYWRQQLYALPADALAEVTAVWPTLDALQADVLGLKGHELPPEALVESDLPLAEALPRWQQAHAQAMTALKAGWAERAQRLQQWIAMVLAPKDSNFDKRKLSLSRSEGWLANIAEWALSPETAPLQLTDAAVFRLSVDGILDALKSPTNRATLAMPPELDELQAMLRSQAALPALKVRLKLHASARVAARLERLKRQTAQFGFSDLQTRLDAALGGASGPRLRERILRQHPVALIDEFQDTSPLQYRLFDRLYEPAANRREQALLLIGDPKQAIYSFRGADIHSYLKARAATAGRHHVLGTNHRSTQALVAAVNHWFSRAESRSGEGAFRFRTGSEDDNPLPFVPVRARGRPERFVSAAGPVPALQVVHELSLRRREPSTRLYAARAAEQIVAWLNDAQAGFATDETATEEAHFVRLRPADIAVLVRDGREAEAVRRELRKRAVASVYLSDKDSVFASPEAHDLLRWLRAVASPLDGRLVRAALATASAGLSLQALAELAASDAAFEQCSEQFRGWHEVWQRQGVLTLLRQMLHELSLPARWLAEADGERRLTNLLHLAELLQAASAQLDGEQALVRWLALRLDEADQGRVGGDEQIVRLESDADLVKVVTVHKSKGLEYPVVLLPFACAWRKASAKGRALRLLGDDGQRHLQLQPDKAALAEADRERHQEDLRLFYVAMTRARHALWLGFAALVQGNGKQCTAWGSAPGYLLCGPEPLPPEALAPALQGLADGCEHMTLQAAQMPGPLETLRPREAAPALRELPAYRAHFDRRWTIGSFSALVRALGTASATSAAGGSATATWRPADDEPQDDTPPTQQTPRGLTGEQAGAVAALAPWHRFERGALAGNFLHDQLEWLAGEGFALADQPALISRLQRRCERQGRGEQGDAVLAWLSAALATPLAGVNAPLQALQQVLPEMEFWLPSASLQVAEVDRLCTQQLMPGVPRPTLPARELHGMLMGFADLVFLHEGRYWVLDYKSNQLGPDGSAYTRGALQSAMAEHRYDVQAALYLLALHRLLRERLGTLYDPARQLGGAVYLFLRGIDGPEAGSLHLPADLPLIDALDSLLATRANLTDEVAP
ncbi:exodeoxyribonuclease V subunit beta [Ideonella sp.]|uniref:exodeoxyribonuclease V subunit beta n=1 Tax=Ideonella sp. TaxID=1929293 RepID=UPI003BB5C929